jgi:2-keto-4-pentenoate hydratase
VPRGEVYTPERMFEHDRLLQAEPVNRRRSEDRTTADILAEASAAAEAATILWNAWRQGTSVRSLPERCRPRDRARAYAVQAALVRLSGERVAGWKIAATSVAGRRHLNVDGPLAGPLLANRLAGAGSTTDLRGNAMRLAEAEFAFRMAASLPPRPAPYTIDEVTSATASLHPAIELPDSRYADVTVVGAPQLIADAACAWWAAFGEAAAVDWRARDLDAHPVLVFKDGRLTAEGRGDNVGGPLRALTWVANELATYGGGLRAGDLVITGTCVEPVAIAPGERVRVDFGDLGAIEAAFRTE